MLSHSPRAGEGARSSAAPSPTRSLNQNLALFVTLVVVSFLALIAMVAFDGHVQTKILSGSSSSSSSSSSSDPHLKVFERLIESSHRAQQQQQQQQQRTARRRGADSHLRRQSNEDASSAAASSPRRRRRPSTNADNDGEDDDESVRADVDFADDRSGGHHYYYYHRVHRGDRGATKDEIAEDEEAAASTDNGTDNGTDNTSSSGGSARKANSTAKRNKKRRPLWHPTLPLFRLQYAPTNDPAVERASAKNKIENWAAAHPAPERQNCSRETVYRLDPLFHSPRPSIAILTIHSINVTTDSRDLRRKMARHSLLPLYYYCAHHRYDLIREDQSIIDRRRAPHWSKSRALRKWLPFYKYVVWLDMDIIITNFDKSIGAFIKHRHETIRRDNVRRRELAEEQWARTGKTEPFVAPRARGEPDIIIGNDWAGINTGITIWRNSKFSLDFLRRLWGIPQELARPFYDQGGMRYLFTAHFRGRDAAAAAEDFAHLDISDELNRYPMGMMLFGRDTQRLQWREGDFLVHMASCKAFAACTEWMDAINSITSCKYNLPFLADNATIATPFYRTDLNATAPPLDEPLIPFPTHMKQFAVHNPRRLMLRYTDYPRPTNEAAAADRGTAQYVMRQGAAAGKYSNALADYKKVRQHAAKAHDEQQQHHQHQHHGGKHGDGGARHKKKHHHNEDDY